MVNANGSMDSSGDHHSGEVILDSEEEILLSDDEFNIPAGEGVKSQSSPSSVSFSPNSKIQDLIESPILIKNRMLSRFNRQSNHESPPTALVFNTLEDTTPEKSRSNDNPLNPSLATTTTIVESSEKFEVSPDANGGSSASAGALKQPPSAADFESSSPTSQNIRTYAVIQRPIMSYMVPRGSPRAMAILNAAKGPRLMPVVTFENGSSDSDSNGSTAVATSTGLTLPRKSPLISSPSSSSSTTFKRSLSVGAPASTFNTSPTGLGSPKRSRQAATRSPIAFVEKKENTAKVEPVLEQVVSSVNSGPSSPPNGQRASTSTSSSSPSFASPLARRGLACLQAVKAKQAEKAARKDTPMPVRAKSLPDTVSKEMVPKSILRQTVSGDDAKSLYSSSYLAMLAGRKPKRVIFSEPLVSSSVEFDSTTSFLVICDTNSSSSTAAAAGTASTDLATSAPSTTQTSVCSSSSNGVESATGEPIGVIVSNGMASFGGGHREDDQPSTSDAESTTRRKPLLYHQNSTFEGCDNFSPPKSSSSSKSLDSMEDDEIFVSDSDAESQSSQEDVEANLQKLEAALCLAEAKNQAASSTVQDNGNQIRGTLYGGQVYDDEDMEDEEEVGGMFSAKSYAKMNEAMKNYVPVSVEQKKKEEMDIDETSDESSQSCPDSVVSPGSSQNDNEDDNSQDTSMVIHDTENNGLDLAGDQNSVADSLPSTESSILSVRDAYENGALTQAHFITQPLRGRGSHRSSSMSDDEYAGSSLCRLLNSAESSEEGGGGDGHRTRMGNSTIPSSAAVVLTTGEPKNVAGDVNENGEPMINLRMPLNLARSLHQVLGRYLAAWDDDEQRQKDREMENFKAEGAEDSQQM